MLLLASSRRQVHLERSNAELAAEDPEDPDFKEAIAENEVILVAQRYKIQQCELRLQQLGGDSATRDVDGPKLPEVVGDSERLSSAALPAHEVSSDRAEAPPIARAAPELESEPEPEPEASADDGLYL